MIPKSFEELKGDYERETEVIATYLRDYVDQYDLSPNRTENGAILADEILAGFCRMVRVGYRIGRNGIVPSRKQTPKDIALELVSVSSPEAFDGGAQKRRLQSDFEDQDRPMKAELFDQAYKTGLAEHKAHSEAA